MDTYSIPELDQLRWENVALKMQELARQHRELQAKLEALQASLFATWGVDPASGRFEIDTVKWELRRLAEPEVLPNVE